MKSCIDSIETFGTVDGPGIRTVIFFSGCKLRCIYCHNPEMWNKRDDNYTVDELVNVILKNKDYFGDTGGVTFSGGEPTLHSDFLIEVCKKLKNYNIHIALDTCGVGNGNYEELLKYIDLILFDVKYTIKEGYKKVTRIDTDESFKFLEIANKLNKKFWIRQVIVPGIMDNEEYLISLKEYVSEMKEGQEKIYYAAGSSVAKIDSMPQVEQVKDKEYDILYLTDYVDEFAITAIQEYEGKKFANIENDSLDLETEAEKEETKKANDENTDMLKAMVDEIKEVSAVKFTNRLKKHPVCLTTKGDVSIEMQKVFDAMPNDLGIKAQTILEINGKHPIAEKLKDLYANDKEQFTKYTKILYSEARMIAGLPIDNPTEISNLICEVISK